MMQLIWYELRVSLHYTIPCLYLEATRVAGCLTVASWWWTAVGLCASVTGSVTSQSSQWYVPQARDLFLCNQLADISLLNDPINTTVNGLNERYVV